MVQASERWYPPPRIGNLDFMIRFANRDYLSHPVALRTGEREGGWAPLLDGRVILTPLEHPLVVPSQHNALMIAAEWEMQQPYIKPDTMPIVRKRQSSFATPCVSHLLTRAALVYKRLYRHAWPPQSWTALSKASPRSDTPSLSRCLTTSKPTRSGVYSASTPRLRDTTDRECGFLAPSATDPMTGRRSRCSTTSSRHSFVRS